MSFTYILGDEQAAAAVGRLEGFAQTIAGVGDRGGQGRELKRAVGSRVAYQRSEACGAAREAAGCNGAVGGRQPTVRVCVGGQRAGDHGPDAGPT